MRRVITCLVVLLVFSFVIAIPAQAGWRTNAWNYSASDLSEKDCIQGQLDYISTNLMRSAQGYDGLKVFVASSTTNDQQLTVSGLTSILSVSAMYRGVVAGTNATLTVKSITGATNVVVGGISGAPTQTNHVFVTIIGQ
jgi:hypothetical protein